MVRKHKQLVGTLPAGQYYIGDPCYVIRDREAWREFLGAYYAASEDNGQRPDTPVVFTWRGEECFLSPTNTGDGCYHDQYRNEFPVDAGLIGAIPVRVLERQSGYAFPAPFAVGADTGRWNKGGKTIYIGPHRIRT